MQIKQPNKALLRPFFFVFAAFAVLALAVHLISAASPAFADAVGRTLSPLLRAALGYLSALAPFSLAEVLIALLPLWALLLFLCARWALHDRLRTARLLSVLLCVLLLFYSLFVFSLGVLYYAPPLSERLSLSEEEPTGEELYETALLLAERAAEAAEEAGVTVGERGSKMPFSYRDMNLSLLASYEALAKNYDFVHTFSVGTKPVFFSDAMAYTGITGLYSYFTGEANVCTALPDFSTVYTAAHEMAHARGIAREDEANFIAFLACIEASDPYIRYAGYTSLLQYVGNALYETDPSLYKTLWNEHYTDVTREEMRRYNAVIKKYVGNAVSDFAESVNNAYLEGMGTEGSVSYTLVVRLGVRYLLSAK